MESRIKSGRREGFTVLYNSMITDQRLSLKTKGLFAVMMSRPDGWEFSVSGLAVFSGAGKDTIRTCLKELESTGYLTRSQAHDEEGKFAGNVYVLCDIASPLSENTDDGENRHREKPLSENPTQINKDLKKRKTKDPPIVPQGTDMLKQLFDRFWSAYPKKQNKPAAWRAWKKLSPDIALCRVMSTALMSQMQSAQWQKDDGQYIPMPSSWLNGRRWEDSSNGPGGPPGGDSPPSPEPEERRYGWH